MSYEPYENNSLDGEPPYHLSDGGRYHPYGEGPAQPFSSSNAGWYPVEELAFLLQDAVAQQNSGLGETETSAIPSRPGIPFETQADVEPDLASLRGQAVGHRRVRAARRMNGLRAASLSLGALTAVIASSVSLFGGMVAYQPLLLAAVFGGRSGDAAASWPLLVYGPYLVASLSILRAALHQRRAVHSWVVALLFSALAMVLCVLQVPRTFADMAAAALPGLASLVCFQQVIRQITLTRPPQRTAPRHRSGIHHRIRQEPAVLAAQEPPLVLPTQRRPATPSGRRQLNL